MGVQRKLCCICGLLGPLLTNKKACSLWRYSSSYEGDFQCCFGPAAEERCGDICNSCKALVCRYRNNKDLSFNHILDSKIRTPGRPKSQQGKSVSPVTVLNELNIDVHNYANRNITVPATCTVIPVSPKKRLREQDNPLPRLTRPRHDIERVDRRTFFNPLDPRQNTRFFGYLLPGNVVNRIMNFLPVEDCLLVTTHFLMPSLTKELNTSELLCRNLKSVPKTGPLTQTQKSMLHRFIVNRENNTDESGCIVILQAGSGGKPKYYLKVPKVQTESVKAAKRTKNRRSQIIEKVEKLCSSPSIDDNGIANVKSQRVNNIKRDKSGYAEAAEEAGLKIVTKFDKKTVLSLRGIMTLRMWRLIKRVFKDEVGWDVFGSVDSMQKEVKSIEFEYECGTVTSTCGDVVQFVRVKDMRQVISQLVNELGKANQLQYLQNLSKNSLWLHTSADKGGKSTKLILQVINQKDRHSIDFAKLLGYFEGKDNRENMEVIFGPLFKDLQKCAANISELGLRRPIMDTTTQPQHVHRKDCNCDDAVTWTPLVAFDIENTAISDNCKYCKKCPSFKIDRQEPSKAPDVIPNQEQQPETPMSVPMPPPSTSSTQLTSSSCEHQALDQTPIFTQSTRQSDDFTPRRASPPEESGFQPRNLFSTSSSVLAAETNLEDPVTENGSSDTGTQTIYTECRITVGGDWEGCAKLLGLSGPNGKQFCNHCLVRLDELRKGVPHAAHILPKYQPHTNGIPAVIPNNEDFLRTFDRCNEKHDEYKAAGNRAKAMNFENRPLVSGGKIIDTFSTTPLHISLGIGLHVLNVVEAEAIQLDTEIKNAEGKYDAFALTFQHKKDILSSCQNIKDKIEVVEDKINQVIEKKKEIIRDRASFFRKEGGRYVNNSELASGVRSRYATLDKEKATLTKEKEKVEKQLSKEETKLIKIEEELKKIKGPFKTKLDQVLDTMKLQRAAYHSGALIGPDVKKLVTNKNIVKLGNVFNPLKLQVHVAEGENQEFGKNEIKVKVITLLTKFKQCYDLYTANRILCRHEVELLAVRCASFGCWFPVNFPGQNLKRKFHLLTVDVPKQARRMQSTGIITEQTIESIHPYINELDRRFAKVNDKTQKGLIICKQQNIYSQPNWNYLKKSSRKK